MCKIILLFLIILVNAGCGTLPFERTALVSLENADPGLMRQEFSLSLADRFQAINTIVFQYRWRSFSGLGYLDVNRELKTFAISCLNPMGIKLFELSGDENSVTTNFVLKELLDKDDLPRIIGEDIRRIYFGSDFLGREKIEKYRYRVIFSRPSGSGVIKHIFAGKSFELIEKRYYEKNRRVFSVFYYEYRWNKGKLYPTVIVLKNYRFGYNLIVRLKEVR